MNVEELAESLASQVQPVLATDTIAEAGRKALLPEFLKMLRHEEGSREGKDPEDVHQMRVAIRRIRSSLRLLEDFYKKRATATFTKALRKVARALGEVRDIDVMIAQLRDFRSTLAEERHAAFDPVLDRLDAQRSRARALLIENLDRPRRYRCLRDFGDFLLTPGAGAREKSGDDVQPMRVRHVLPALVYDHLGHVRAYDDVLTDADDATLHRLRIEFKRLRYLVALFADVMGSAVEGFLEELKRIQDHLGELHDAAVARHRIDALTGEFAGDTAAVLSDYSAALGERQTQLRAGVLPLWSYFNSTEVQTHLAMAVASL